LFQLLETAARPVAKTVEHLEPVLRFEKACPLLIKLGLIKLLAAPQDLLIGFGGVNEGRPFTITDDKLMDRFAALGLTLASPQPTKKGVITHGFSVFSDRAKA
jgi:hypothetical protein